MKESGAPSDHPHTDPGDGRTECERCGKYVWLVTHSCKGVPVTARAWAAQARPDPLALVPKSEAFLCPDCGTFNRHPKDIEAGYCTWCHWWTKDATWRSYNPNVPWWLRREGRP